MINIIDLPLELVDAIVRSICHRCICRSRRQQTAIRTLHSLCLVSKLFYEVASRHLYHRPQLHKWPHLARTLISRPDLAKHVKQLLIPVQAPPHGFNPFPPEVEAYTTAQLAEWVRSVPEKESYRAGLGYHNRWRHPVEDMTQTDYMTILASLTPNLEKLEAGIDPDCSYVMAFCKSGSLPRLRKVLFDSTGGIWTASNNFGVIRPLLLAAPNLQRIVMFKLTSCTGLAGITLRGVTHLDLINSVLPVEDFKAVLRACPNLEILEYECGHPSYESYGFDEIYEEVMRDRQFTPSQARDAILKYAPKLEFFRFNVKMRNRPQPDDDDGLEDEPENGYDMQWGRGRFEDLSRGLEERGIEFELIE